MFVSEALYYGLKGGLKLGCIYLVWMSLFPVPSQARAIKAALAGAFFIFAFFLGALMASSDMPGREFAFKFSGYVFFLFFFAASIVQFRRPIDAFHIEADKWPSWVFILAPVIMWIYFAPDAFAASIYLKDLAVLKQTNAGVFVMFFLAVAGTIVGTHFVLREFGRKIREIIAGQSQLLITLVLVSLVLGGPMGFSESSLVPTVQRGVIKFIHDVVHQTLLFLMVPDHPMLQTSVWNFIGVVFRPDLTMMLSLLILLAPSLSALYHGNTSAIVIPSQEATGAARRLFRRHVLSMRLKRSIPAAVFILIVSVSWFVKSSEDSVRLYVPESKPLTVENSKVIIPISSPGSDLLDGNIHKFSLLDSGRSLALLIVKKPDGKLAVMLDACEICPPDGYGQRDNSVVCIYCMTPIPLDTLGRSGGCNPVPIEAEITDTDIQIDLTEIRYKWETFVDGEETNERPPDE